MNNYQKNVEINAQDVFLVSGGYRSLKVFQIIRLIQDITLRFTMLYIPHYSRTRDQMEQAARSGKQNIAEGSVDAATSSKMEINLYNIARGSLEELKNDYEDYLRINNAIQWDNNHPFAKEFIARRINSNRQFREFIAWAEAHSQTANSHAVPLKSVLVANGTILLINVATFWLTKLNYKKMQLLLKYGGFSEKIVVARLKQRSNQAKS